MNNDEIVKVEAYLRKLFKTDALELKEVHVRIWLRC